MVDRATVHRLLRREAGNALPRHRRPARRFEMRAFALTEAGVRFAKQAYALYDGYLSSLYADRALTSMLDRNFYDLVNQLYFGATATALVDGDLVEFVRRAYATLSTLRGYYLLRPLLLVSNLNALESEVGHFMERTEGRVTGFTKEQAQWVFKVRRAAPDLDGWYVWRVAAAYQLAVQKGTDADRESLDALLAFAPWRSLEAAERFREWASRVHPDWFSLPRFIIAPAGMPFSAKDARPLGNVAGLFVAQEIELDLRMRALNLTERTRERPRISIREHPANEEEESNEPPGKP